jgi:transposase
MEAAYHRHDISDAMGALLEDHPAGRKGTWGGNARDNRQFLNACFCRPDYWRLDLTHGGTVARFAPDYGGWKNTHRRFCRWRDKGVWEKWLELPVKEPDFEWLMIDASHVKVHPDAAGAVGGNQDMERTKGGSIPKSTWPRMCNVSIRLRWAVKRHASRRRLQVGRMSDRRD